MSKRFARSLAVALLAVAIPSPSSGQTDQVSPPPLRGPSGTIVEASLRPDRQGLVYLLESTIGSATRVLFAVDDDGPREIARIDARLVGPFEIAPGGHSVAFRQLGRGTTTLHVASPQGIFPSRRVSPAEMLSVEPDYVFSPHDVVVFRGNSSDGRTRLYSASATGRRVVGPLDTQGVPGTSVVRFRVSPDGRWVAFSAIQDDHQRTELHVVQIDGSAPSRKRSGPFLVDGAVGQFRFAPDSSRIVYLANQERPQSIELYSVPVEGDRPAIRLNPHGSQTSDVAEDFVITPDGASVLYRHDLTAGRELFRVGIDGGLATRLNPTLVAGGAVQAFLLAPDGSLVYRADQEVDQRVELFRLVEGRPTVKLSGTLAPTEDVDHFQLGPDGSHVAYGVEPGNRAHLVTLDRSIGPVAIPAPGAGLFDPFLFSADGKRLVFTRGQSLFSLVLDGASEPLLLLRGSGDARVLGFQLELSGGRAVVQVGPPYGRTELYAVALDGSAPPMRISAPLPMELPIEAAFGSQISPDGRRAVFGFGAAPDLRLLAVNLATGGAPLALTSPGAIAPHEGLRVWISPDSARILFREGRGRLHGVPIDGSSAPVLLGTIAREDEAEFAPDGTRFLHLDADLRLRSAAIDGSSAPVLLGGFPDPGTTVLFDRFRFSADGTRVAYSYRIPGETALHLLSSSTDGGVAAPLAPALAVERLVGVGTADRVAFQTRSGADVTLWSVPIDGSAAPLPLATAALAQTPEDRALVGGGYVYFEVAERLFVVPVDGSGPASPLAPTLRGSLRAATNDRLIFVGYDPAVPLTEFFSVPGDGHAPPTRISRNAPGGSVYYSAFEVSPSGDRIVYLHDVGGEIFGLTKLFAAPIDGSAEPVELGPPDYGEFQPIWSFRVSADLSMAAIEIVTLDGSAKIAFSELFVVPTDGSRQPERVAAPPTWINYFRDYHLDSSGRSVLHESNLDEPFAYELFVTRIEAQRSLPGPRAARR